MPASVFTDELMLVSLGWADRVAGDAGELRRIGDRRLHGQITLAPGYTTPAAFEAAYYRQTTPAAEAGTQ